MLKVGIIGVGNIGNAHAKCIFENRISQMTLCALCDIDKDKAYILKKNFPNVNIYFNHTEMLANENLDAVIVSTPHKFHADIAIDVLKKGVNVLVEKPVDISVTKAKKLNDIAQKSGKVFAIMFNQRTNPLFQKAYEIVQSGLLGELKRTNWIITNWYRTQQYYDSGDWRATWYGEGGGVLMNQAPHNLDLWQWICGMPCDITAFCNVGKYHNIEVEDDVTIFTNYKNGATGTFITSTGEYPGTNRLEILGNNGKIIIENGILKFWKLKKSEREYCFSDNQNTEDIEYEYFEVKQTEVETSHIGILQNFSQAIINGEKLLSPGFDGINELTIANAAYLSSWKGNIKINLPFDNNKYDEMLASKINISKQKHTKKEKSNDKYLDRWKVIW